MALALLAQPVVLSYSIKMVAIGFLRLGVGGNLDVNSIGDLESMLDRLLAREPWRVELDLSRLELIDSTGVGALVRLSKRLKAFGCLVTVRGLHAQPLAVFRLLGLDRRLWGAISDQPSC